MLDKNLGRAAFLLAFVGLAMILGNCVYAQKEPKGPDLPETQAYNPPVCPTCKSKVSSRPKGMVTAPIVMHCPDCKKEMTEAGVAHCDKCGKDFLACIYCMAATKSVESKCPKCKKVLARRIKGKIESPVKWNMKCPDCRKKPDKWNIHHCDQCEADFLACPLCEEK